MEALNDLTYDIIVLLQPTTPLRRPEDIDAAIDKLIATGADSVISVCEVGAYHPARMRQIIDDCLIELPIREPKEMLRRQDLPPIYIRNGAIYAVQRQVVMLQNSLIGKVSRPYIMSDEISVNVDSKLDFLMAEILLRQQH
jgi:N-acylneuraminate cytidylyltransferase